MNHKANFYLGYSGPEWDKKIKDKDNPNFWKYGVANLIFSDLVKDRKTILDIGCGTGGLTLFLAEHLQIDNILGIDPVKSMIQVAKQYASKRSLNDRVDFIVCDGRQLPFKRLLFDALVSRGDAFVFLVPQKTALDEFKRVLKNGAIMVVEMDNVTWKPGKTIFQGFEKMMDGSIAYSVEHFDVGRDHFKVFYALNPQSMIVKKTCKNEDFIRAGRLKQRFPLKKIKEETIEIKHGVVTHWPTVDEIKKLCAEACFKDIEVFGDGLLMGLLLERDQKVVRALKKQPELFFEIERRLIPFIDPRKAHTIVLKSTLG